MSIHSGKAGSGPGAGGRPAEEDTGIRQELTAFPQRAEADKEKAFQFTTDGFFKGRRIKRMARPYQAVRAAPDVEYNCSSLWN
jgi:hypothetical protein